jgi:hypothetical protein
MSRYFSRPRIQYGLRQGYLTERNTYATDPPQPHSQMGLFVVTDPQQMGISPQMQFVTLPTSSGLELTHDGLYIHPEFTCVRENVPTCDINGHVFPLDDIEFRVKDGNPILYLTPYRLPLIRLSDQLLEILDPPIGKDYQHKVTDGRLYIGRHTPLGRISDTKEVALRAGIKLECPALPCGNSARFKLPNGERIHLESCDCRVLKGGKHIGIYSPDLPDSLASVELVSRRRRERLTRI